MSDRFPMATPERLADTEYLEAHKLNCERLMAMADGYGPGLQPLIHEFNLANVYRAVQEVGEDPDAVLRWLIRDRSRQQLQALRIARDVGASFAAKVRARAR